MLPILNLGPIAIPLPGLFLILGVWIGSSLIDQAGSKRKLPAGQINNLVLLGLLSGILAARVVYVLRFLSIYRDAPLGIFSLNPSTFAPEEGVLIGLLIAGIYANRKSLPMWPTLDVLSPGLAAFSIAWGFANLASGDGFGASTNVPWAIDLWGAQRHPSQVYEIVCGIGIFMLVRRAVEQDDLPGISFLLWLGMTALSRLALEAFRGDSVIRFGSIREAQLISLAVVLVVMLVLHTRVRTRAS